MLATGGQTYYMQSEPLTLHRMRSTSGDLDSYSSLSKDRTIFDCFPHMIVTHLLRGGIMGEVLVAKFANGTSGRVVLKCVDMTQDDLRSMALKEIKLYEGPLRELQGTVVPHFFGAFKATMRDTVYLVLEYVGQHLHGGDDWGKIDAATTSVFSHL